VDLGCAPGWIVSHHPTDEFLDFGGDRGSAGAGPRDRQRQNSRNPTRCQPTTVSGFTITSTSVQRADPSGSLSDEGACASTPLLADARLDAPKRG